MLERKCPICGADMTGRRRQAVVCSGRCRAEASRIRRLLSGQPADGRQYLDEHRESARKRTSAAKRGGGG